MVRAPAADHLLGQGQHHGSIAAGAQGDPVGIKAVKDVIGNGAEDYKFGARLLRPADMVWHVVMARAARRHVPVFGFSPPKATKVSVVPTMLSQVVAAPLTASAEPKTSLRIISAAPQE